MNLSRHILVRHTEENIKKKMMGKISFRNLICFNAYLTKNNELQLKSWRRTYYRYSI